MNQSTVQIAKSLNLNLNDPNSAALCQSIHDAQPDDPQVQPATDDDLIANECILVAFYYNRGDQVSADHARERLEQWVLQKHGKRS